MDELQDHSTQQPVLAGAPSHRGLILAIIMVAISVLAVAGILFYVLKRGGASTLQGNVTHNAAGERLVPLTKDTDHDGLSDAEEAQLGTSPNNPDTDGDGLTDEYEVHQSHTDPLNAHTKDPKITDYQWLVNQSPKF